LLRNRDETEDNVADWVFGRASRDLAENPTHILSNY